jgi:hypothetical protein
VLANWTAVPAFISLLLFSVPLASPVLKKGNNLSVSRLSAEASLYLCWKAAWLLGTVWQPDQEGWFGDPHRRSNIVTPAELYMRYVPHAMAAPSSRSGRDFAHKLFILLSRLMTGSTSQMGVQSPLTFCTVVSLCRSFILRHVAGFNAFWYSHMLLLLMFPLLIFHGSRRPIGQYPTTSVSLLFPSSSCKSNIFNPQIRRALIRNLMLLRFLM